MNEEIRRAAEEVLANADESDEYKRRLLKLLGNAISSNYTDADLRQVVELVETEDEE